MNAEVELRRIFTPIRIGTMTVRNRFVMAPMGTNFPSADGFVTKQATAYYEERARGGVGLVIVEASCIESRLGRRRNNVFFVDDDSFIPGLAELARAIKRHGARAAIQLNHAGREAKSSIIGLQPVGPSGIASPGGDVPRELSIGEIGDVVTCFCEAAERVRKAGFDGIEIQAAHHYLLAQFLSGASNRRTDSYGGDLVNRGRLLVEIIKAIKGVAGDAFPVWCRLNAVEYGANDGFTLDEAQRVAGMIENAGANAIHVSAWAWGSYGRINSINAMAQREGYFVDFANAIKKVTKLPVIAVGKIGPELGDKIVEEGKADLIAMGKALIAEPNFVNKLISGRRSDITPCIECQTCRSLLAGFEQIRCSVNPCVGKEVEWRLSPAAKPRKVIVVGGGPGGMEAAWLAAQRGHEVVLCEKSPALGGQLLLAEKPPHKSQIHNLISFLSRQMAENGVRVELDKEVTPEVIDRSKPDVVIVATGSTPIRPKLPGFDRKNVVTATEVLADEVKVGHNVAIVGGGSVGCETAEFLADRGSKVVILEILSKLAWNVGIVVRPLLMNRLKEKGVVPFTEVRCEELNEQGMAIIDHQGKRKIIPVDTVVLAVGARPNTVLLEQLFGRRDIEIFTIGDCTEPRGIREAMSDGFRVSAAL